MFGRFSSKRRIEITSDIHSHLLPGIDDGVKDFEESIEILEILSNHGFKKIITTPHIYQEYYPNKEDDIKALGEEMKSKLQERKIKLSFEVAAEYYMDDALLDKLENRVPLLSFGLWKYVLIETGFYSKPIIFNDVIRKMKEQGYAPILAHPERYLYLENRLEWLKSIKSQGVLLQVSLPSLMGAYGKYSVDMAKSILKAKMADFLASDLHRPSQLPVFLKALEKKIYPQELLNNTF